MSRPTLMELATRLGDYNGPAPYQVMHEVEAALRAMTTPSETRAGKLPELPEPVWIAVDTPGADFDVSFFQTEGEAIDYLDGVDPFSYKKLYTADQMRAYAIEALAASEPVEAVVQWWCAECARVCSADEVTYHERHDVEAGGCGHKVVEREFPAPEQPGKGEAAVDFVCTGYLAALSDAYHTLKGTDRQFQADKLSELHTLLASTPLYATPQPSDPAEGDAKCIWPDCGHDTNQSDPTPGCNGIGCSQPTATVRIDEAMTLAACNAYDRAAVLDGEELRELAQYPWMHAALVAAALSTLPTAAVSEAMVERAARGLHIVDDCCFATWDELPEYGQSRYRDKARAALTAALDPQVKK